VTPLPRIVFDATMTERDVSISRPDKVLWPDEGVTKQDFADYLDAVADDMVPWLRERPLTLVRAPDGVGKHRYYQKAAPTYAPDWIATVRIPAPSAGRDVDYVVCQDAPTLRWLGNQAVVEFHPAPVRRDRLDRPDLLVVDVDPPEGAFDAAVEVVFLVLEILEDLGLAAGIKTTGGKGLHVVVPIEPTQPWDVAKGFCKAVAELLVRTFPDRFTSKMTKSTRGGRIFVDYLRNAENATAIAPYSARAKANAPVAMPIAWEQLAEDLRFDHFNVKNVPSLLRRRRRDPWAELAKVRQELTAAMLQQVGMR
jgi:bifunctional non-homologous end joining protein LigD